MLNTNYVSKLSHGKNISPHLKVQMETRCWFITGKKVLVYSFGVYS